VVLSRRLVIVCAGVLVVLLLIGEAAARWHPFYARQVQKPLQSFGPLEGLRGFLAIAVFFHHAELTRHLAETGEWESDEQSFLFLGRAGVACFFMITALLFWTKVLASDGKLDYVALFRSRLRRILPMYEFSVACLLVGVAWQTGFRLHVPVGQLIDSVGRWLAFAACGQPDVNGLQKTLLIGAGVYWTLTYEWAFYVALPVLAVFRKGALFAFMLAAGWFCFVHIAHLIATAYFIVGILVATAFHFRAPPAFVRHPAAGAFAVLLAVLSCLSVRDGHLGIAGVVMLAVFFYIVAGGNTLGGLLVSRAARVLGMVSYSLYVMQGIALFVVRSAMPLQGASPGKVALFDLVAGVLLVVLSLGTYEWIERPFIVASRPATAS
jgi:peptidoglycan/LPS O-acetylase OafA/YrhL